MKRDEVGRKQGGQEPVSTFRPDIQGLRAVAVVLVVAYHAGIVFPGGFIGVDVFFVLSGYVITRMITNELAVSGRLDFRRFYLRRIRRLLPALALLLAFAMLAGTLLAPLAAQQVTARTGASAALLNANTYLLRFGGGGDGGYFGVGADSNALLHTWSLSVEEQFYLVFPALLAGVWLVTARRKLNSERALGAVLSLIVIVSFPLSWLLTTSRLDPSGLGSQIAFYSAPARAWEFAVGGLLAMGAGWTAQVSQRLAGVAAAAGAGLLLVAGLMLDGGTAFPGTAATLPVAGTVLLLGAGEASVSNPAKRVLSLRPFQVLGDLSYSWYLWHWPLIVFATGLWPDVAETRVLAAGLSLLPAWMAYRWVESPIRFHLSPRHPRTLVLGSLCVLVPLIAAAGLNVAHSALSSTDKIEQFDLHADVQRGCDNFTPLGERDESRCFWAVPNSSGLTILVGDSNAGQHTEGFVAAANSLGFDAVVATKSSCPFVDLQAMHKGSEERACRNFVQGTVASLVNRPPTTVVIASSSDGYIESGDWAFAQRDSSRAATAPGEKAAVWETGLASIVARLESAGIKVVIVHPVPKPPPDWKPIQAAPLRLLGPPQWTATSFSRSEALETRARAVAAEVTAAGSTALVLDLAQDLCPEQSCRTHDGTRWLYRDSTHISIGASLMLISSFEAALAAETRQ